LNSVSGLSVKVSVVVPVYNEAENIPEFVRRVTTQLESCVASHEILFAVDPSSDGTEMVIEKLSLVDPRVRATVLSRRFGQPAATICGLERCKGDAAIVMDCDLQDPPELLPSLISKWHEGFDVVYAKRRHRDGETRVKKLTAKLGYSLINRLSQVEIPQNTGDFRLISRRVIEELRNFPETHGFLRGLVALVGFSQTEVLFDRPARYSGTGKYNRFVGSLRIGFNGIFAFSSSLLNLSTIFGVLAALLSFVVAFAYGGLKLVGVEFPIGNPTIVTLILLIGGLQLVCLGIMGQYVARIYDESKRRPRYIVDRQIGGAKN